MKEVLEFVKKFKILLIVLLVLIIGFIVMLVLFKSNPERFNFKTITYVRNEFCDLREDVTEKAQELNLYQILGTTDYSDKLLILNTFDVDKVTLKSYRNKPGKLGEAELTVMDCEKKQEKTLSGRYVSIKDYVVVYLESEVFIFRFDKKDNKLIDYNNSLKTDNKIQYDFD